MKIMIQYMDRRNYKIPKREIFRTYEKRGLSPTDLLLPCDYDDTDTDTEDE